MAFSLLPPADTIRFIAGTLALLSWLSLLLQWTLMYGRLSRPAGQLLARFFGYFTILSNTLAALSFTLWFVFPVSCLSNALVATLVTAICVYMIIVAIIYHSLLRKPASLQGLNHLVNGMLHTWLPILYVVCWQLLLPSGLLEFRLVPCFMIFPVLYFLYIMIHGSKTGHYPYPFINVLESGYTVVLRNAVLIALVFMLLSCLLIWWKT